jgi:hypothetical protein
VQVRALHASAALLQHLSDDENAPLFQDLIPGMLNVARMCLERHDEDTISKVKKNRLFFYFIFFYFF